MTLVNPLMQYGAKNTTDADFALLRRLPSDLGVQACTHDNSEVVVFLFLGLPNLSVILVKTPPEFPQLFLALELISAHSRRRKFRQTLGYDVHDANRAHA